MRTFHVHEYVDGDLRVFVDGEDIGTIPFDGRSLPLPQQVVAVERKMGVTLTDEETKALLQELAWPRRW